MPALWKCQKPDCGKQWISRVEIPTYCPNCKTKHIEKISDDPFADIRESAEVSEHESKTSRWSDDSHSEQDSSMYEVPVAREATRVIDPQDDFINMLNDFGIKTKKQTLAIIFFSGDIDDPSWMDRVLKEGNIDMARRRLAIMRWYGAPPEEFDINVTPGPTEKGPFKKGTKTKKGELEDDDDVDKIWKEMKLEEIRALKEEVSRRKLKAMKKKLAKEDDDDDEKPKGKGTDENLIEVPLTNPQTGVVMLDDKQRPIMMRVSPQQYFFMQQNMMMAKAQSDAGKSSPDQDLVREEMKYWREQTMAILNKGDDGKYEKMLVEMGKQREGMLKGVFDLREQVMRKELDEVKSNIRGPDEWYSTIMHYVGLGEKMGLVQGDPKQMIQSQMANQVMSRMNDMQQDGRLILQEAINAMRMQTQRQMQTGVGTPAQAEAQRPLSEQEKQSYYMQGAEDYKKALEVQMAARPGAPPPVQQPPSTGPVPPPPPPPKVEQKPGTVASPVQPDQQHELHPQRPPEPVSEPRPEPEPEPKPEPPESEVPAPSGFTSVVIPVITPKTAKAEVAEESIRGWGADSPISNILRHPMDEEPEKKTSRWSESD